MMKMKSMASTIAILILAVNILAGENSQLVANLKAGKPQTIVTYGTSLTAAGAPWVSQLQQILKTNYPGLATVINSGGSGQWSQWGVSNLDARVIAKKPDTVFIEFGINDAVVRFNCTVEQSRSNLTNMVDRILSANPAAEIILMTMNPAIGDRAASRPRLTDYYQMYRDVAKERKLKLIDHYANWEPILRQDKALFSRYVPDDLHPGPEGCKNVITPAILKALGIKSEQPAAGDTAPRAPAPQR